MGLIIGLGVLAGPEVGALGAIPLFIGAARIIVWKLESNGEQAAQ